MFSSESTKTFRQTLPNKKGLYYPYPLAKETNVAAITAKKLMFEKSIIFISNLNLISHDLD